MIKSRCGVIIFLFFLCLTIGSSCRTKKVPLTSDFKLGKIKIIDVKKATEAGEEITLMTRFEFKKNQLNGEQSNYFQYQLGKKIKLVLGKDTLQPVLFYYIPMINELEKEIDVKFLISKQNIDKTKRIIIHDSILDFNKINISFK